MIIWGAYFSFFILLFIFDYVFQNFEIVPCNASWNYSSGSENNKTNTYVFLAGKSKDDVFRELL